MAATAALAMTGLLWLLLRRSWLGRAIVAVRMDRDAAALMGIRVRRVYIATFALGAALAGAAGALLGPGVPDLAAGSPRPISAPPSPCACWAGWAAWWGPRPAGWRSAWSRAWRRCIRVRRTRPSCRSALLILLLAVRPDGLFGRKGYA